MNLVHYCPGSAPGTPAWLRPDQADAQYVRDTRYLQLMRGVGAIQEPVRWPHTGGQCIACQPNERSTS